MSVQCRKLIFAARSKISSAWLLPGVQSAGTPRCCYSSQQRVNGLSPEEENLIVKTINSLTASDCKKYSISEVQMRKLLAHRDERGKFETFDDLLTVQSVPSLIKLSKSIISGGKSIPADDSPAPASRSKVQAKNVVTPPIDSSTKATIKGVVGLHIQLNAISWANLDVAGSNLTTWSSETFENSSKTSLVPLINTVINITSRIPDADAYVLETDPYMSLVKMSPASFAYHIQRQQAITAIISSLSMRRRFKDDSSPILHNFYTLQARWPARLFNLIVGSETVSADRLIADILAGKKISQVPALPAVNVNNDIYDSYRRNEYETRKTMQSALLVSLAFANSIL